MPFSPPSHFGHLLQLAGQPLGFQDGISGHPLSVAIIWFPINMHTSLVVFLYQLIWIYMANYVILYYSPGQDHSDLNPWFRLIFVFMDISPVVSKIISWVILPNILVLLSQDWHQFYLMFCFFQVCDFCIPLSLVILSPSPPSTTMHTFRLLSMPLAYF